MQAKNGFRIALINLLVLSVIGVLLRYKIAFELEFVDQKHVLHGHSHFAFAGWVSQALMVMMIAAVGEQRINNLFRKYNWLLLANLITAYGMLVAFILQGYGAVSITFSTLSILVSYVFGWMIWREMKGSGNHFLSHLFFKSALIFNVLSSLGAFALAYMMANKIIHQNWYLSAIYFFLHFQYNGWFTMACFGFVFYQLERLGIRNWRMRYIAYMFISACIPAYFLSVLWMEIPDWLHGLITFFALIQLVAWYLFIQLIRKNYERISAHLNHTAKLLFVFVALAMTIKVVLQAGSTIHVLSNWAFGYRPIVIGYLHLVLLGVISLFILGYALHTQMLVHSQKMRNGIKLFISGIVLNECLLMAQGVAAISNTVVPYANNMLLSCAMIMFIGLLWMNVSWKRA